MADFQYIARAPAGSRVVGSLQAASERDVLQTLEERGLLPISVRPVSSSRRFRPRQRRPAAAVMTRFFRQLSDLLRNGVALLRALELLERQTTDPGLAQTLSELRKEVADGAGLAETMKKFPLHFSELAVSMIRAGEEGGFLEDVLSRIADYTEREEELKGKVIGALAYPLFLLVIGGSVISILIVFFVPQFEQMFTRLKERGELPAVTTGLLATSDLLRRYGILLIAAGVGLVYAYRHYGQTPAGRLNIDRLKLAIPRVGDLIRSLAIVRFSRVLGTLLANGIPILNALRIAKDSCGNLILSAAVDRAADNVTTGESLTEPLRASGHFPRDMIEMVSIAEESNTLEKVLVDIADSTEKRTTRQLELMVRLLEPLMLLVMALITLVVVAALLLPILRMSSAMK